MILVIVLIVIPLIFVLWENYCEKRFPLPTGDVLIRPPALPLLGHIFYMLPEYFIDSIKILIQRYGKFLELFIFNKRVVFIADVVIGREVLANRPKGFRRARSMDFFAKPLNYTNTLFFAAGNEWSMQRRHAMPSFNKVNIHSHIPEVWKIANRWAKRLEETPSNEVVDFKAQAFGFTIRVITKVAFGIDEDDISSYFNSTQFSRDIQYLFRYAVEKILFPLPDWMFSYSHLDWYQLDQKQHHS